MKCAGRTSFLEDTTSVGEAHTDKRMDGRTARIQEIGGGRGDETRTEIYKKREIEAWSMKGIATCGRHDTAQIQNARCRMEHQTGEHYNTREDIRPWTCSIEGEDGLKLDEEAAGEGGARVGIGGKTYTVAAKTKTSKDSLSKTKDALSQDKDSERVFPKTKKPKQNLLFY
ncbi:hypothetical protein B0H19DRAFT_1084080 [Mycena capillaripes]|nr:hypothetical protein B0H19DRAFT_1084080 [Mycena capillaripes]